MANARDAAPTSSALERTVIARGKTSAISSSPMVCRTMRSSRWEPCGDIIDGSRLRLRKIGAIVDITFRDEDAPYGDQP